MKLPVQGSVLRLKSVVGLTSLGVNLSRYGDKLEQSDPADQKCLSASDVIPLMFGLRTVFHINLYLEHCGTDVRGKKKLIRNLKCLSLNAGDFGN